MLRPPLTPRQTAILDAIRASVRDRGHAPTLREVGAAVGLHSSSSVAHQLRQLQSAGAIRLNPGTPRGIVIPPPLPPGPGVVDLLAAEIRRVDGAHVLGAGALAEALMPWVEAYAEGYWGESVADQG